MSVYTTAIFFCLWTLACEHLHTKHSETNSRKNDATQNQPQLDQLSGCQITSSDWKIFLIRAAINRFETQQISFVLSVSYEVYGDHSLPGGLVQDAGIVAQDVNSSKGFSGFLKGSWRGEQSSLQSHFTTALCLLPLTGLGLLISLQSWDNYAGYDWLYGKRHNDTLTCSLYIFKYSILNNARKSWFSHRKNLTPLPLHIKFWVFSLYHMHFIEWEFPENPSLHLANSCRPEQTPWTHRAFD